MRYIPTSTAQVEQLKKLAKRLQRKEGGKRADALNRVAKGAGYAHWHHVSLCLKQSITGADDLRGVHEVIQRYQRVAADGGDPVIGVINVGVADGPMVIMAALGDAWLFEPRSSEVMVLAFRGEPQPYRLRDVGTQIEIQFDGTFILKDDDAVIFETDHPLVGERVVVGLPVPELLSVLERAMTDTDERFASIFGQADTVDLTPEIANDLIARGWKPEVIEQAKREGARYSLSRGTLLTPVISG